MSTFIPFDVQVARFAEANPDLPVATVQSIARFAAERGERFNPATNDWEPVAPDAEAAPFTAQEVAHIALVEALSRL